MYILPYCSKVTLFRLLRKNITIIHKYNTLIFWQLYWYAINNFINSEELHQSLLWQSRHNSNLGGTIMYFNINFIKEKDNKTFRIFLMLVALSYIAIGCSTSKSLVSYNSQLEPLSKPVISIDKPIIKDYYESNTDKKEVVKKSVEIIKRFEQFKSKPYRCPGGALTIGYGFDMKRAKHRRMSEHEASKHLKKLVLETESFIRSKVKNNKLTKNQMIALISFVYNIGEPSFENSTLLKLINKNKINRASKEFNRWVYVNSKHKKKRLNHLVVRRQIEKSIFTTYT